jgi:hypothetical protein
MLLRGTLRVMATAMGLFLIYRQINATEGMTTRLPIKKVLGK